MNKQTTTLVAVLAVLIVAGAFWYYFTPQAPSAPSGQQAGLANPASTNCVQALGGTLEIADETQGQVGYCHLPDGRVCEEWALFRNEGCTPPPATPTAAAGTSTAQ